MPDDVIGSAFVEIRPDTSGFESALQSGLAGPIARLGNSVGGPLKAAVAGVAAVAGATIGVGVAAVDMAAKFDKSLSQIAANADIPKQAAEKIGDAFLTTGGKVTFTAEAIASAFAPVAGQLALVNKGALDAGQSLTFMNAAMALAEASGGDLATTTEALAQIMQVFGIGLAGAASASDLLFNASRSLAVPIDELAGTLTLVHAKIGPIGGDLASLSTLMLDLAEHGVTGSRALRTVSSAFDTLLSGSKPVSAEIAKLGLSIFDASGHFVGIASVIDQLAPRLDKLSQKQRIAAEDALFGKGAYDRLDATLRAGATGWDAAAVAADKAGSAQRGAVIATDNLAGSFERLKTSIADALTRLGQSALTPLSGALSGVARFIGDVVADFGGLTTASSRSDTAAQAFATTLRSIGSFISTELLPPLQAIGRSLLSLGAALGSSVLAPLVALVSDVLPPFLKALGFVLDRLNDIRGVLGPLVVSLAAIWATDKVVGWGTAAVGAIRKVIEAFTALNAESVARRALPNISNLLFGRQPGGGVGGVASEFAGVQRVFVVNWPIGGIGGVPAAAGGAAAGEETATSGGLAGLIAKLAPEASAASLAISFAGAVAGAAAIGAGIFGLGVLIEHITGHADDLNTRFGELVNPVSRMLTDLNVSARSAQTIRDALVSRGGLFAEALSKITTSAQFTALSAFQQQRLMEDLATALRTGAIQKTPQDVSDFAKAWEEGLKRAQGIPPAMSDTLKLFAENRARLNAALTQIYGDFGKAHEAASQLPSAINAVTAAVDRLPKPAGDIEHQLAEFNRIVSDPRLTGSVTRITAALSAAVPPALQAAPLARDFASHLVTAKDAADLLAGKFAHTDVISAPLSSSASALVVGIGHASTQAGDLSFLLDHGARTASGVPAAAQALIRSLLDAAAASRTIASRIDARIRSGAAGGGGFQSGGIVNAPASGEQFILHGLEAVIPKDRTPDWLWQAILQTLSGKVPEPPKTPTLAVPSLSALARPTVAAPAIPQPSITPPKVDLKLPDIHVTAAALTTPVTPRPQTLPVPLPVSVVNWPAQHGLTGLPGFASGGLVSFPRSGGLAWLHGMEAILARERTPAWLWELVGRMLSGEALEEPSLRPFDGARQLSVGGTLRSGFLKRLLNLGTLRDDNLQRLLESVERHRDGDVGEHGLFPGDLNADALSRRVHIRGQDADLAERIQHLTAQDDLLGIAPNRFVVHPVQSTLARLQSLLRSPRLPADKLVADQQIALMAAERARQVIAEAVDQSLPPVGVGAPDGHQTPFGGLDRGPHSAIMRLSDRLLTRLAARAGADVLGIAPGHDDILGQGRSRAENEAASLVAHLRPARTAQDAAQPARALVALMGAEPLAHGVHSALARISRLWKEAAGSAAETARLSLGAHPPLSTAAVQSIAGLPAMGKAIHLDIAETLDGGDGVGFVGQSDLRSRGADQGFGGLGGEAQRQHDGQGGARSPVHARGAMTEHAMMRLAEGVQRIVHGLAEPFRRLGLTIIRGAVPQHAYSRIGGEERGVVEVIPAVDDRVDVGRAYGEHIARALQRRPGVQPGQDLAAIGHGSGLAQIAPAILAHLGTAIGAGGLAPGRDGTGWATLRFGPPVIEDGASRGGSAEASLLHGAMERRLLDALDLGLGAGHRPEIGRIVGAVERQGHEMVDRVTQALPPGHAIGAVDGTLGGPADIALDAHQAGLTGGQRGIGAALHGVIVALRGLLRGTAATATGSGTAAAAGAHGTETPAPQNGFPSLQSGGLYDFPRLGGLAVLHGREWVIPDVQVPSWLREALQAALQGRAEQFATVASATRAGASLGALQSKPSAQSPSAEAAQSITVNYSINVSGLNANEIEPRVTAAIRRQNHELLQIIKARR